VADKHSVFLDKMNLIHGFGLAGDGAYVAQTPNLILARDSDGITRPIGSASFSMALEPRMRNTR
jgi:hypothetical protein